MGSSLFNTKPHLLQRAPLVSGILRRVHHALVGVGQAGKRSATPPPPRTLSFSGSSTGLRLSGGARLTQSARVRRRRIGGMGTERLAVHCCDSDMVLCSRDGRQGKL
jgi:hypothetical protein